MDSSPFILIERASPSGTFNGTPPAELPAENGIHVWRAAIATPLFTFCFVALRLYTRAYIVQRKYTLDDYIAMLSMLVCIAHAVLMAQATHNGMGLHIWQFNAELNARYYLWIGITSEFYVLGLCGFKCALILQYLELFGINIKFRRACYCLLFFCVGYLLCNMITEFFGCTPIEKKWYPSIEGHCINSIATNSFYGACSMASDLAIAILPLVMIWRLQFQSTRQKLGLSLVLSCGFIAWAVAVARWAIGVYNMQNYDRPWWAGISFTLSILEINTGLICACATTLGPLWKVAYAKARGYSSRGDSEASSWPSKYRRSDVFIKNKAPNRLSYIQRHRDGPLEKSDVLLTPPRRVRRDDTLFSNGDEEYGLIDFSDPHAVDSVGDVERGNRTI